MDLVNFETELHPICQKWKMIRLISGNTLAVTCYHCARQMDGYLFRVEANGGKHLSTITANDMENDEFGRSVSMSEYSWVGAYHSDIRG